LLINDFRESEIDENWLFKMFAEDDVVRFDVMVNDFELVHEP
jgi:hypothetical protein